MVKRGKKMVKFDINSNPKKQMSICKKQKQQNINNDQMWTDGMVNQRQVIALEFI